MVPAATLQAMSEPETLMGYGATPEAAYAAMHQMQMQQDVSPYALLTPEERARYEQEALAAARRSDAADAELPGDFETLWLLAWTYLGAVPTWLRERWGPRPSALYLLTAVSLALLVAGLVALALGHDVPPVVWR